MTKLEIVLNGIEEVKNSGIQCPLENVEPHKCFHFPEKLIDDIVSMLKSAYPEPRLMTEADFDDNPMVDANGFLPAWCEHKVNNGIATDLDGWDRINKAWVAGYMRKRYWTSRPSKEQREATPWKE